MKDRVGHPPSAIRHPRRILVRGANWLGDAVMTTPALQRLREAHPQAHIALLTPEKLAGLWLRHPAVSEIISFAPGETVFAVARRLRERSFEVALVLPNSPRSALEVWLARIPRRAGYARFWRNWFLTDAVPPRRDRVEMKKLTKAEIERRIELFPEDARRSTSNPSLPAAAHQVHEYLHLGVALGADPAPLPPFICVQAEEVEAARQRFALEVNPPRLGLVPGAEYGPAKRWPKENFIAAARELQRRTGCGVVIFGGKAEVPLAREIESALCTPHSALRNLAGQTALRELGAALKLCRVVLTNDTGPMHLAAALGTPVVALFGSTSLELTGPGLPGDARHRLLKSGVPCSPCFLRECPIDFRCLNGISVETVVQAVLEIMEACRSPAAGGAQPFP